MTHLAASTSAAATTNSSVEEGPGLTRSELGAVGTGRVGNVATTVGDPGKRLAAALVGSLDVVLSTWARVVDVLLLAAVGANPLVAELAAEVDSENVVRGTVDSEVSNGAVTTVTAGELSTGDDGDSSEVICNRYVSIYSTVCQVLVDILGREQATLWDMDPP